jgi:enamine deaminase RidA (YjgF/YER057c/UK114 family)
MHVQKKHLPATSKWAAQIGYSRGVRAGPHIWISGTVAVDAQGQVVGPGDAYVQSRHILGIVQSALTELGADLSDVVRTRVYLKDWSAKDGAAQAHLEAFGAVLPAATFVLAGLVEQAMLVEMEVEAYVTD